jgi:hypothetical protein
MSLWLPRGHRSRYTKLENEIARLEALRRAPAFLLEQLDRARELRGPFEPRGSLNTWSETLYSSTATETALTAAAAASIFPASTVPGYYGGVPGGYMVPHRTLHLRVAGQVTTAATPGTFLWKLMWGGNAGTALVASGGAGATGTAITGTASLTNSFWRMEFYITARGDIGTAAAMLATGIFEGDLIPTTGYATFPKTAPAAVNVDTTTFKDLAVQHTPSLTTASIAGMQFTLEAIN